MKQISFGKIFSAIHRHIACYINRECSDLGIGSGQFGFYIEIARNPGVSQEELSKKLWMDKATTAKAVRKLMELGYLERQRDEKDRRLFHLYLSESGKANYSEINRIRKNVTKVLSEGFSNEEKETLSRYLEIILRNIETENST